MIPCYGFNCDCLRCSHDAESPREGPRVKTVVGEQYRMNINGSLVRVLLISQPTLNEHDELRAHVIVLEENLYVRAGAQCRPLAHTLVPL